MNDLHELAANSREAAWTLAASSLETRNAALLRMAETLENHQADIFAANAADIHQAEADGLAAPLLGRLKFREGEAARRDRTDFARWLLCPTPSAQRR